MTAATGKTDPLTLLVRKKRVDQIPLLEAAYQRCNEQGYLITDPVEFLWRFDHREDREVFAWLAAGLAYGRVASIRKSLEEALIRMSHQPFAFLNGNSEVEIAKAFSGFQYRWTRDHHVTALLVSLKRCADEGVEVQKVLKENATPGPAGLRDGFAAFRNELLSRAPSEIGHLLPGLDGACKRPAMMLRWMVRKDNIDPGDWSVLDPAQLWIPLDVHMFRIAKRMRLTRRANPDAAAAIAITKSFSRICPEDPIRYDFCLTRMGMKVDGPID